MIVTVLIPFLTAVSISEAVLAIYKDLEAKGLGDLGTQALLKHYLDV